MTTSQHSMNGTVRQPKQQTPALSVQDLSAGYDRTSVLDGVNLEVAKGGVTALLGPNGAGKTTLLRAITGLIGVGRGRVLVRGQDMTRTPLHQRARLGLCHIPEGRGIYRTMTVKENLRMQVPAADESAAVEKAVSAFPVLGRRLEQMAGTMSGGEQQMLALAAAYTRKPSMIVVDELSLGLAPVIVDQLFEFLARLVAEEGVSLLVVDQYAAKTLEIADRAYVMRKGQIVYDGAADSLSVDELFERYLGDPT
jgi:branched-chain amino acid transport system ATP-binding protein